MAAVAVVVRHVATIVGYHRASPDGQWWLCGALVAATRWCVPVFVLVTGALVLDPRKSRPWGREMIRRLQRVGIPLVFWTLVYTAHHIGTDLHNNRPVTAGKYVRAILNGRPIYHMWYLYMLPGLYVVAPLLRSILSRVGARGAAWLAGLTLAVCFLQGLPLGGGGTEPFVLWFIPYMGYLVLGHVLRFRLRGAPPRWATGLAWCAVTTTMVVGWGHYRSEYVLPNLGPMVALQAVLVVLWAKASPSPNRLSRATAFLDPLTFGIYLSHVLIMSGLHLAGVRYAGYHAAVGVPLVVGITLGLSVLLTWGMRRVPLLRRAV
jgi:surface polysaccharide O-acyltransferase-like enzyme